MKRHLHLKWKATIDQTFVANLDPEFFPVFGNTVSPIFETKIKQSTFLGGEPYLRFTDDEAFENIGPHTKMVITQRADTVEDFFRVVLAADAAKRLGFSDISLVLPYFPGARQDRVCNVGESLTVKVYADMINSCGFSSVHILTPHSDVTPALINNVVLIDDLKFAEMTIGRILAKTKDQVVNIICPDAGAGKRIDKIAKHLTNCIGFEKVKFNVVRCEKERDLETGELLQFRVGEKDLGGNPCVIFDDIVSMGGTFIGLGKELREHDAGELYLSVTHADCRAGLEKMTDYFNHVFVTNSRKIDFRAEDLTVFDIRL